MLLIAENVTYIYDADVRARLSDGTPRAVTAVVRTQGVPACSTVAEIQEKQSPVNSRTA